MTLDNLLDKQVGPTTTSPADWGCPEPLQNFRPPEFPLDALPGWISDFVSGISMSHQSPPDLTAMYVLAVSATALQGKVTVHVSEEWSEPVNLYTATCMASGERKSPAYRAAVRPLSEAMNPKTNFPEAPDERVQRHLQEIAKDLPSTVQRPKAKARSEDRPEALCRPVYFVNDVTSEMLVKLLSQNRNRMAVLSSEGGIFDTMAGKYSSGAHNFEVYLKAYSGDCLAVYRLGRDPDYVFNPHLTVGLAFQPDVLREISTKQEFRGRGLLARFLYSVPTSWVGRRQIDPPPMSPQSKETYNDNLRELIEFEPEEPLKLWLSPDARGLLFDFQQWVEDELACGELEQMEDWGNKLVGQVLRLAGIFQMAEVAERLRTCELDGLSIDEQVMARTTHLGRHYFLPHAKAVYEQVSAKPVVLDAKQVVELLQDGCMSEFTVKELFDIMRGRFPRVSILKAALNYLTELDYVRQRPAKERSGAGRPPSPTYDVNPWLWRAKCA